MIHSVSPLILWLLPMVLIEPIEDSAQRAAWIQWRGPERNSEVPESYLPENLDLAKIRPLWRVEMGPSYSGPIVAAGKVFTTETVDKTYEVVKAFDLQNGEEIWRARWEGAMEVPFFARRNGSWIRATPTYDQGRLYVAGMEDMLICLDATSGKELWRLDFPAQFQTPRPTFGFVSSPLVDGQHLYVQAGAAFVKLDKSTGEIIWRTLTDGGGMMGSAFSSPVVGTISGRRQVVVQTRSHLAGVAMESGEVLWQKEIPSFRGMNILTPMVANEKVFTSNYRGRSYLFGFSPQGEKELAVNLLWENKSAAYMSSPVVIDGHVYQHLQNKTFNCIDLETGEEKWRSSERFGDYWSMVVHDQRILALDQKGELLLIRADPESFQLLDRRVLSEQPTWAHLAVTPSGLFVRELYAMTAYAWQ